MSLNIDDLCLGVLSLGEASGYDIRKLFEEGGFRHFMAAGYGSIYPALTRLTKDGLIDCRTETQEKRPDRKVYSITAAGQERFQIALGQLPARDSFRSEFIFMMIYPHLLTRNRISALIDQRIIHFEQCLAEFHDDLENHGCRDQCQDNWETSGAEFALRNGIAIYEAEVRFLKENRHLVEDRALPATAAAAE